MLVTTTCQLFHTKRISYSVESHSTSLNSSYLREKNAYCFPDAVFNSNVFILHESALCSCKSTVIEMAIQADVENMTQERLILYRRSRKLKNMNIILVLKETCLYFRFVSSILLSLTSLTHIWNTSHQHQQHSMSLHINFRAVPGRRKTHLLPF
jgi:hypothetical protein